jgi:glyoxylase-like metal-dependent hydrolase (beta-lactamase superfamily II)
MHAIQTGTVRVKQRQIVGNGQGPMRLMNTIIDDRWSDPLPIYAWVLEHPEGVIVIDTGETAHTANAGYFPAWHPYYQLAMSVQVEPDEEIGPQMQSLGIAPDDVRYVIMTHLHTDHAGGISHFPRAEFLVSREEYRVMQGMLGQLRGYLPQHLPTWFAPRLVDYTGEPIVMFAHSFPVTRGGDVVIVPTPGHTPGHQSVIVQDTALSYFFAGDATYREDLLLQQQVDGVASDVETARRTLDNILKYTHSNPTVYLPSHDPESVQRLHAKQAVHGTPPQTIEQLEERESAV